MTLLRTLSGVAVTLLALGPARPAEVDSRLPADTEVVLSINLEQLLHSPLGKKYLRTTIAEAIKAYDTGQELLKYLELDPLRDINRITLASPAAASNRGLIIVQGKFNRTKLAELAEKVAAEHKDK